MAITLYAPDGRVIPPRIGFAPMDRRAEPVKKEPEYTADAVSNVTISNPEDQ